MNTSEFAEKILKLDPEVLKRRTVFIKFIVASGKVIFDPELFVFYETNYGEDSLYHKDIAGANNVPLHTVQGGAFVGISHDKVIISGFSTQFGGIEDHAEGVAEYFSSYFDCPVEVKI